jgi:hypothetical protein
MAQFTHLAPSPDPDRPVRPMVTRSTREQQELLLWIDREANKRVNAARLFTNQSSVPVRVLIHYTRQTVRIVDKTLNTVQLTQEKNVCFCTAASVLIPMDGCNSTAGIGHFKKMRERERERVCKAVGWQVRPECRVFVCCPTSPGC